MRRLLRFILLKPVLWAVNKFSSKPDRQRIFTALSALVESIQKDPGKKGLVIPFEEHTGKFIIFSDQHKGTRNGADDFKQAETNYLAALNYYSSHDFCFINLGDSEELWENSIWEVKKKNKATFEAEKKFLEQGKYVKVFGNHDLYWDTSIWSYWHLKSMFGEKVKVYEGVVLKSLVFCQESGVNSGESGDKSRESGDKSRESGVNSVESGDKSRESGDNTPNSELTIFLTHGHQGDAQSDGNWFSKFFVAYIWAPLQSMLRINPNTPAYDAEKKTLHNHIMYEWIAEQKNMLLVTGHTHQPVFQSLTHLERLYKQLQWAEQEKDGTKINEVKTEILKREKEFTAVSLDYMTMKPSYFNTGCCCFNDGDITGIEIAEGNIRLIKWKLTGGRSGREVLEETVLCKLVAGL
ncbi:MAG: metallophosphoesterase [Bacteroidota bacterium]|nr:metallophosphoesterase [Bacteroidota bacterium]